MKRIGLIVLVFCIGLAAKGQTKQDTVSYNDTVFDVYYKENDAVYISVDSSVRFISFYENYDRLQKYKKAELISTFAAGGFVIGGAFMQVRNTNYSVTNVNNTGNSHIILYSLGGLCGLVSIVSYIYEIREIGRIRNKHDRINFTPNGVRVNLK